MLKPSLITSLILTASLTLSGHALADDHQPESLTKKAESENCDTHHRGHNKKDCDEHKSKENCDTKHHYKKGKHHGKKGMHHGGHFMREDSMLNSPRLQRLQALNLTPSQSETIEKLTDELYEKNWDRLGELRMLSKDLTDLYRQSERDAGKIDKTYKKLFDLQRKMIVEIIETENKATQQLTEEQRSLINGTHEMMQKMH